MEEFLKIKEWEKKWRDKSKISDHRYRSISFVLIQSLNSFPSSDLFLFDVEFF